VGAIIRAYGRSHEIKPEGKYFYPFFIAGKITIQYIAEKGCGTDDNRQENSGGKADNGKTIDKYFVEKILGCIGSKHTRGRFVTLEGGDFFFFFVSWHEKSPWQALDPGEDALSRIY
jgi:hypothetical protein